MQGLSGRDIRDVCEEAERQWAAKVRWVLGNVCSSWVLSVLLVPAGQQKPLACGAATSIQILLSKYGIASHKVFQDIMSS